MSLEYSRELIKGIADRKEAEAYIDGLLTDTDMRADMERSEQGSKWDGLTQERGLVDHEPPQPEREMER